EEETVLVRAGRLTEAAKLEAKKSELSSMYIADTSRFKASQVYLDRVTPAVAADLRQRHDTFRAVLQMNMTVLATAHAVSESIMRGVSFAAFADSASVTSDSVMPPTPAWMIRAPTSSVPSFSSAPEIASIEPC